MQHTLVLFRHRTSLQERIQHIACNRDGLHLSGKGAAVFAEGLSGAVASGLGKVRYLN